MAFKVTKTGNLLVPGKLYFFRPREKNPWGKYEVVIGNLEGEALDFLRENKYNVKHEPDGEHTSDWGHFLKLRSGFAPKVTDSKGDELPEEQVQSLMVGNGSDAEVLITVRPMSSAYRKSDGPANSLYPTLVRLINVVPYEGGGLFDPVEDGFKVEPSAAPSPSSEGTALFDQSPLEGDDLDDPIDF